VAIWFAVRRRFAQNGASLVEYALLLALIAVAALLALYFLGGSVSNSLNNSGNTLFPTS
jgi:Flp pilus assembly pilin Flp